MQLKDLPTSYKEWLIKRDEHLHNDLEKSHYTVDLYKQYRKHLGAVRYRILIESQKLVVPQYVNKLLGFGNFLWIKPLIFIYKQSRKVKLDWLLKSIILPAEYKQQIKELDVKPS